MEKDEFLEEAERLLRAEYPVFNNSDSQAMFIGNRDLQQVIDQDTQELQEIGGSFMSITERMDCLIKKADELQDAKSKKREEIIRAHGYDPERLWAIPGDFKDTSTPYGKVMQELKVLFNTPTLLPSEEEVELVEAIGTRGFQRCPFQGCKGGLSSRDYIVRSRGRKLWINPMTSHLARAHHLLEKDNEYGISAREFYKYFMPDPAK